MVRLILDGTVVRVRLDRKATSLSVPVALGVQMPLVSPSGRASATAVGDLPAEFEPPLPHRLMAHQMPRAASISSTMRRLSGNRKYSQTA